MSSKGNNIVASPSQEGQNNWDDLLSSIAGRDFPWDGEYLIAAFDLIVAADESGIHDSAVVCLLAGYIASVPQWTLFTERWNRILVEYDVADFHSKDFFASSDGRRVGKYLSLSAAERRSYGGWTDQRANDFIAGLTSVIDAGNVYAIGAAVDVPAFRAFTYGERRFLTGGWFDGTYWKNSGAPSKPYFLVYDHCLVEAGNQTKAGLKTLFIFDEQHQYESRAIEQFGASTVVLGMKNKTGPPANRLAGVFFRSRRGAPGLQAADLYAHCWHRYLTDEKKTGRQRRGVLEALTAKRPGMGVYDEIHMEGMLSQLPPEVRAAMRATKEPNSGADD